MSSPPKWLITGGCGFIGTNLIRWIINQGPYHIRVIDNLSVGTREALSNIAGYEELDPEQMAGREIGSGNPESNIELVVGDITDAPLALEAAAKAEIIVHLAASTGVGPSVEEPRNDCHTNVLGTLNYLESARKNQARRFILASSGAAIGECEPPIHEGLAPHPVSPYGAGKLAGEAYCSAYYYSYGLETIALRFGNVYGPGSGQKNSVVAKFIKQALAGQTLEIYGDGKQTRDFIYIDDLIRAVWLSATVKDIGGEVFQIASNSETNIVTLCEKLIESLGQKGIKNINLEYAASRKGDVFRNFSDISKSRRELKWCPEISLDKGLNKTIDYFLKNYPG